MEPYKVTLSGQERAELQGIAAMLCVSERKVDRVKKKFVLQGLELTLNRQPAKSCWRLFWSSKLNCNRPRS